MNTESVAAAERFDYWAHEVSRIFGALESRPGGADRSAFHARAVGDSLGPLRFAEIDAAPQTVRRVEPAPARDDGGHGGHYKVAVQIAGACLVEQDGVRGALGPGDIALCDTTRPYSFTYDRGFRTVLMLLPRALLPVRPELMRTITGRRLGADGGVAAVVGPFVRSLSRQSAACSEAAVTSLTDGAVSLVTALAWERLAARERPVPQNAMFARIRAYIEARLAHPDLTPDAIAAAHGVSRRYLFKLFAAEGLTVAGWIRCRRLEHCARELASPAAADQPISRVAARWGLLDGRHFSRLFKSVYGQTPRDYRRRSLAEGGAGTGWNRRR
ncbi:AraC-like ligand-binding domain-containing protein [Streptomyces varsoviensis]|uniref:AraC-like ligand-binding domain-containing protein n=1 Tax=Streptomyces varsoviensis TaxID=67373 RepID=UPI00147023F5|nr:helix-turn-helix domain-containing protein [Streptomyces varsoviensis]